MRRLFFLSLAMATALSAAGCDTPQGQNAAGGALLGGIAGATTGAMIGSASTPPGPGYYPPGPPPPPARCAEWYFDYYGNRVCRAYY